MRRFAQHLQDDVAAQREPDQPDRSAAAQFIDETNHRDDVVRTTAVVGTPRQSPSRTAAPHVHAKAAHPALGQFPRHADHVGAGAGSRQAMHQNGCRIARLPLRWLVVVDDDRVVVFEPDAVLRRMRGTNISGKQQPGQRLSMAAPDQGMRPELRNLDVWHFHRSVAGRGVPIGDDGEARSQKMRPIPRFRSGRLGRRNRRGRMHSQTPSIGFRNLTAT